MSDSITNSGIAALLTDIKAISYDTAHEVAMKMGIHEMEEEQVIATCRVLKAIQTAQGPPGKRTSQGLAVTEAMSALIRECYLYTSAFYDGLENFRKMLESGADGVKHE